LEKGAAEAFERALGEAAQRFGWKVHAQVVMRNHFHLARVDGDESERRDEMAAGDVGAANESVPKPHRTAVSGPVQGVGGGTR